jgi:NAD(P)H-quinone oxidoreductase subunit 5
MGFMLVECGLGLYELAFLHLIGHSLYKAYAFLSAGEAVLDTRRARMLPAPGGRAPGELALRLLAAPAATALMALTCYAWQLLVPRMEVAPAMCIVAGLGLAPLLWGAPATPAGMVRPLVQVMALAQLYLGWHVLFGTLIAAAPAPPAPWLPAWVASCFLLLYGVQAWLLAYPDGQLGRRLYPWAYHGFYLDESFTRLTFRLWPVRLAAQQHRPFPVPGASA